MGVVARLQAGLQWSLPPGSKVGIHLLHSLLSHEANDLCNQYCKVIACDFQDSVIKDIHGSLCLALLGHWLQGRPAVIPCGSSSSPVGRSTWGGTQDPPWGVELPVQSSLQMTLQPLLTSWLQTHERYGARTTQLSHCQVPDLQDCEILNGHVVSHYVLDY